MARWKKGAFARLAIALLVLVAPAAAKEPQRLFDYRQAVLDNGLQVITLEDFSCPIVSVQVWYQVGAKDEPPDRHGFAHMFEHMMFRGTDRLGPTDHFDLLRRSGGWTNGFTSFDLTTYLETLPSNQLELALWLEAERMAFLRIDQANFDTERKVVEEERRLSLNQPFGTVTEKLFAEIFKEHPYRWPPLGNIANLRASSVGELRDFWKKYYVPSNAALVIAGAVKHQEAQELAKRYFGWIPKHPQPPRVTIREPQPTTARSVTIREKNAPVPTVQIVFRTVPVVHDDSTAMGMLSTILGGGQSSRLYRDLVAEKQIAASAYAWAYSLQDDGLFGAGAVMLPLRDPGAAMTAITGQIERLRTQKVSHQELLKARNQKLKGAVMDCLAVTSKASMLGRAAISEGDVARVNSLLDRIRKVTEDDLLRVAKTYLAPDRALQATVVSAGGGAATGAASSTASQVSEEDSPITAKPEEKAPPPGREGAKRPENYPTTAPVAQRGDIKMKADFVSKTLDNGLKVIVVTNSEVPFVSVHLGMMCGEWSESKSGSADLAVRMLTKGTAGHTEAQLADELETYAISLNGGADMDTGSVRANCVTEHAERMMGLLGEVVLSPTFPAEEFEKLRKKTRAELTIAAANPSHVADREFNQRLWGEHPYSRGAGLEVAELDALSVDDLKQWWSAAARPDLAVLIFAGDIEPDKAMELARKTFGQWQAKGPKPQVDLPEIPRPAATRIYVVDQPGMVQSQIRVGRLGITRRHPDYFTSVVVNGYFGGAFGSRLNKSLRVEKGLTYGVWGGNSPRRFAGEVSIHSFTKTEATARAVRAIMEEVQRLRDVPPSTEELETTRSNLLGRFPAQRETPLDVARELWLIESDGLPADYFEKLLSRVAVVTGEDCRKIAAELAEPDRLVIVIVGDAEKMRSELEKIAPVTVVKDQPRKLAPATQPRPATKAAVQ